MKETCDTESINPESVYSHQMQKILVEKMTRIERLLTVLVKIECSRAGLDYEEVLK